jgi:hypothetical protein
MCFSLRENSHIYNSLVEFRLLVNAQAEIQNKTDRRISGAGERQETIYTEKT